MAHRTRITILVGIISLALVAAACGDDDDAAAPGTTAPGPSTTTTSPPDAGAEVDWEARTVEVDAPEGWSVDFCEGDAPLLCVERDGQVVGSVELIHFHRATIPGYAEDIERWAHDVYEAVLADREQGCPPSFRLDEDPPEAATVAGEDGVRYSFTGSIDGSPVERTVGHALVRGDVLFLIGANAYEEGGCVATEGNEFTVDTLRAFEPVLAALAAGSVLPDAGSGGTTSGYLREIHPDGRVVLDAAEILTGAEAEQAAREQGDLAPGEELETDFYVLDPEPDTIDLRVGAGATVQLVDCAAGCEPHEVDLDDFLSGDAQPSGGDDAIFEITIAEGEVVALAEQYLP